MSHDFVHIAFFVSAFVAIGSLWKWVWDLKKQVRALKRDRTEENALAAYALKTTTDMVNVLVAIAEKPWSDHWMFEVQDMARAALAQIVDAKISSAPRQ